MIKFMALVFVLCAAICILVEREKTKQEQKFITAMEYLRENPGRQIHILSLYLHKNPERIEFMDDNYSIISVDMIMPDKPVSNQNAVFEVSVDEALPDDKCTVFMQNITIATNRKLRFFLSDISSAVYRVNISPKNFELYFFDKKEIKLTGATNGRTEAGGI